jgi:bifunctional DNase/RNase
MGSPIEVKVKSLLIYQQKGVAIILLEDTEEKWGLPIMAKASEVASIDLTLRGQKIPRPLSHDLMASMIQNLNARVLHVLIDILEEPLCHGIIALDVQGREMDFDSRPSDAIALALRAQVPIYVSPSVMAKGGVYYDRYDWFSDLEGKTKLQN